MLNHVSNLFPPPLAVGLSCAVCGASANISGVLPPTLERVRRRDPKTAPPGGGVSNKVSLHATETRSDYALLIHCEVIAYI